MESNFKKLEFKHRRNDILGAINGHLTEDACFLAVDEIEKQRNLVFTELHEMRKDNKAMTVTEQMEVIAMRSRSIQEYTFFMYCLGQEATAQQVGSGIIKIIGAGMPPPTQGEG